MYSHYSVVLLEEENTFYDICDRLRSEHDPNLTDYLLLREFGLLILFKVHLQLKLYEELKY